MFGVQEHGEQQEGVNGPPFAIGHLLFSFCWVVEALGEPQTHCQRVTASFSGNKSPCDAKKRSAPSRQRET
jgi:hypothetical protein